MYKLVIIILALIACCLTAPAEDNREWRHSISQNAARPGYLRQNIRLFEPHPRVESIETEEWGVDKREAPETEPVLEAAATTEDPDLKRIKEVNALAYGHPVTISNPVPLSLLF